MIEGLKKCVKTIFGSFALTIGVCFCGTIVLMIVMSIALSILEADCVKDCKNSGGTAEECMEVCGD